MADNVGTVVAIYEAFGRGDVAAILDRLADDVEWETGVRDTGLPYLRERHGKAEVAEFFSDLAQHLVLTEFEPLAFCDGGDYVAVPVRHAGHVVGGTEIPSTEEIHLWRFGADGTVIRFRHHFDLAVHERSAAGRAADLDRSVLRVLDDTIRVDRAGGLVELFELRSPRDSGPPPHAHPWDELYIGIDGEVEVTVGDAVHVIGPDDVVVAPAGTLHSYRTLSEQAHFRVVTSGHRASLFFADLHTNAAPGAPTPESLPGIIEIARRNGLSSPLFA